MTEVRTGFWSIVAENSLISIILFLLVVFLVLCWLTINFGNENQLKGLLETILLTMVGALILFVTLKDHIELSQPNEVLTTPEYSQEQELDVFLKKKYQKEYKIFSVFNPENKLFNETVSVFVAERTSVKVGLKVGEYTIKDNTLTIQTLKSNYNQPVIPIGEKIFTYYEYQEYSESLIEDIIRNSFENAEKFIYSNQLNAFSSRAYKLTVLEARKSARKKIIEDYLSEDILSDVKNISIDGIYFKKDGSVVNVKRDQIDKLFNIDNEPEIDPPTEKEVINLYFEGEPDYNEKIKIFDEIKKYRQRMGMNLETGFKNKL